MMSKISKIIFHANLAIIALFLSACTKEELKPLQKAYLSHSGYVRLEASFCNSSPVISKQKVKYLFIMDKSDSNQPGASSVPGDASNTDSNGNRRYGPLIQFLRDLPADPNILTSFSMINFNDNAYVPTNPNFVRGFDADKDNFESVVRTEWIGAGTAQFPQPIDRGFTNYVSALQFALNIIQADAQYEAGSIERPIVTSAYRIIFVSDGEPRVAAGAGVYTQSFGTDLLPQISAIQSLKNDPVLGPYISDVVVNTAYYFSAMQNFAAASLLEQLANSGNGQFMKFGAGENVIYGAFAPPSRSVRQVLADVFVDTESAVWWKDGKLHLDSDGDGVPDSVETSLGSSGSKRDTDGNGVSDFVEYSLKGKPCQDGSCSASGRNPFSVCDGLRPTSDGAGGFTFPDTDKDGLNDCEEFNLKSDATKFDSNGDLVPDFIALKAGVPFIAGTDGSFVQPQGDGLSNYAKIKKGLPIQVPSNKIGDFKVRETTLTKVVKSAVGDKDCYQLTVDPVSVQGQDPLIRVYIIENTSIIDDKPKLRIAEGRVDPTKTNTIVFKEGEFSE
jgi:hypothetical protein